MKKSYMMALDQERAEHEGGYFGIQIWFTDETDEQIMTAAAEILTEIRQRINHIEEAKTL
jgi:hypothetical protein